MPAVEALPDHRLLVEILKHPESLSALPPARFLDALNAAEQARLLGWLQNRLDEGYGPRHPSRIVADRLCSVVARIDEWDRALYWEFDRVQRAFFGADIRWVLLKGAGYLAAGVPCGRGRKVADIDLLVGERDVARAEELLKAHGWRAATGLSDYDERYYREWMHELPPFVHSERGSVLDLHHGILPRTSRLHPSPARLMERAVAVSPGLWTLAPSHMVLHAAAHLFHDGEISGAIRDLVDLDVLLRHYGADPGFWSDLESEAAALTLTRPAFYAIRYAHRLLGTPLPPAFRVVYESWGPPAPIRLLMDRLVAATISGKPGAGSSAAALALYIRSHWLKMPPVMLVRHLTHQALRSD